MSKALTQSDTEDEVEACTDEEDVSGLSDDSIEDANYKSDTVIDSSESDVESESASNKENIYFQPSTIGWNSVIGPRNEFELDIPDSEVAPDVYNVLLGKEPIDFFDYFISGELMTLIVCETNRFAAQKIATTYHSKSRIPKWIDTNPTEIRKFLGLVLWMGLVRLPKLRDYWSTNILYQNKMSNIMSRNRFELLLTMLHFSDNSERDSNDRLGKISMFVGLLQNKFKEAYTPGEDICIDESNVPFRGRIFFRQYIPNKRHKYGIKLFKLCTPGGYTWSFKVYTGKEKADGVLVSEKVVMELLNGLLDNGRTLYTDNWYTSVSLARTLVNRQTHLVGTLRSNRKSNPRKLLQTKLKSGEICAEQNENKIVVLKWKDKRDVIMLSTKHDHSIVQVVNKGTEKSKPAMIVDYNKGKAFIDLSDQMSSYSPCLRRTLKWYKRLFFHLVTATTVVNALHLYNKINNKKIDITKFKEEIVKELTRTESEMESQISPASCSKKRRHILKEVEGQKRTTRKRCSVCYKSLSKEHGSVYAGKNAKRVNTICESCDTPMCLKCFQMEHNK